MATTAREEAIRKAIHIGASLLAAAAVWWLPHLHAAVLLAGGALVALGIELGRMTRPAFRLAFQRRLGPLLRDSETTRLTGATTLALGYTIAAVLFPGSPALIAILVAGVADAAAAVVGKRFGRIRYRGGKSVEGSVAFLVVVLPVVLLLTGLPLVTGLLLALIITALEAPTLAVADNLYLPLGTAAAVHLAGILTAMTFFS